MPTEEKQQLVRQAADESRRPDRQGSGRVTLPLGGNRYAILANSRGLTPAGEFWKTLVGHGQGKHGLGADSIQRSGNREFLFPQGGKK